MSKTERKSQNIAHDTQALGLVKPIFLPKFLVDYLSKHPILLSYMQNTTKKFAALIDGFARQGLVTNKRQMIEWIPVLSTSSIFMQCMSLRDPYGSAFLKIFIPKHYEESSEPCFKKKNPLGENILNLRWTESI